MPTRRGRNHVLHASGTTPRRANTNPMRAAVDAMRTSMGSVSVMPKPTAGPLIAAMTGFGITLTDRKSTRLNSSHVRISYAVFCLKKKKQYLHLCNLYSGAHHLYDK